MMNYASLLDMPELEQLLRDNTDKLYDDNKNAVPVDEVLQGCAKSIACK